MRRERRQIQDGEQNNAIAITTINHGIFQIAYNASYRYATTVQVGLHSHFILAMPPHQSQPQLDHVLEATSGMGLTRHIRSPRELGELLLTAGVEDGCRQAQVGNDVRCNTEYCQLYK
jgi:hypothetical protein